MRRFRFLLSAFVVFIISCSSMHKKHASDKVKSFIPGTYVRAFEGEYSIGNDTLKIQQPDAGNNYYTIEHTVSYQQLKDKQPLPVEYKTETWIAVFNEQTNVLEEQTKGKRFSFLPDENAVLLGGSRFKKIQ